MSYAKEGSLKKCLSNINKLKWQNKLQLLKKLVLGLKVIHESTLIHRDLHDGNILMSDDCNEIFIIDLGLCKPVNDLQDSSIYGVIPYIAPEVLRGRPYTPESDIYSFSMIMWEFTSGTPPFQNKAHNHDLLSSICEGKRPEIIENTPSCYIDLMKKCWDSDPFSRPTIIMLENIISEWSRYINLYYEINKDENEIYQVPNINNQLRYYDMLEFVKADKALVKNQANTSIEQSHPQACYISRKIAKGSSDMSDCLSCVIEN
jgi:serine/threonine protein kinase